MEIRPGVGVGPVELGHEQRSVRRVLGEPTSTDPGSDYYPHLVVRYDAAGTAELLEVPYDGEAEREAIYRGVRLTGRPMDDVLADLTSLGLESRPSEIGHDFAAGFAIWSMGSLMVSDVDPHGLEDDERLVVEGVSVGRPAYFDFED